MMFVTFLLFAFVVGVLATFVLMLVTEPDGTLKAKAKIAETPDEDPRKACPRCSQPSRQGLCSDCLDDAEVHH